MKILVCTCYLMIGVFFKLHAIENLKGEISAIEGPQLYNLTGHNLVIQHF